MVRRAALVPIVVLAFSCGADERVAPFTPPPPDCPEADDYLAPLYRLEDEGRLAHLAGALRERVPELARRDLIDALLALLGSFEDGDFSAIVPSGAVGPPTLDGRGLQVTLGRVLRWVAVTGPGAPNLPLVHLLRGALASCEGAPVFALLADAARDPVLVDALAATLRSDALREGLTGLDFDGADGRQALTYLVRNLLVSATSDAFDVAAIVDLLGLLVDLDAPPFGELANGLERLLDADGLPRLQSLLVCLQRLDHDLVLGGFLYDLLTSGLLAEALAPAPDGAATVDTEVTDAADALRELAAKALDTLAGDAEIRRGLVPALISLMADDLVAPVLSDVADLLSAEALSGVFDLVGALATGQCRVPP